MPTMSRHFQIEPLADGVYAAICRTHGAAMANAGIIDLGNRALLFDLCGTPQATRDLLAVAEYLTGQPVSLAINSHWHPGHTLGNQALPPTASIISTRRTRDLIAERIPQHITRERQRIPRQLRRMEEELSLESEPDKRRAAGDQIDFLRMLSHDLPLLNMRLPNLTFDHKLVLHGTARSADLLTFGGGHTASDAILYLADHQIAFMGDLLFHQCHPWLGDGDADAWIASYDQIEALTPAVEVVVPGHGPITTPDAFASLRRYVHTLRQLVADIIARGGSADDAARQPVPAAFSTWERSDHFTRNMRYLFEQVYVAETPPDEAER